MTRIDRPTFDQAAAYHHEKQRGATDEALADIGYVSPDRMPEVLEASRRLGETALIPEITSSTFSASKPKLAKPDRSSLSPRELLLADEPPAHIRHKP